MKVGMALPGTHPHVANEMMLGLAESLQLDSVWLGDHLLGAFHPELFGQMSLGVAGGDPDACYDPFCVAAALGRMTEIPIGIAVTDSIRRRPADVARSTLTLQQLCKSGFHLGVGSGESENLIPFGYPSDMRVGRTEAFLRDLRCLLDTGRMPDGVGRTGIPLRSEMGKPPVWLASHGPRMLRLAGQYGDGWLPVAPMTREEYGQKLKVINNFADAAGRKRPEPGWMVSFLLGGSRDEVAEGLLREPLSMLPTLLLPADLWRRHGLEHPCGEDTAGFDAIPHELDSEVLREVAKKIPVELFEEWFWIGNAKELAGRMEGFAANGCEHTIFINLTGLVGGPAEFQTRLPDLGELRRLVGAF